MLTRAEQHATLDKLYERDPGVKVIRCEARADGTGDIIVRRSDGSEQTILPSGRFGKTNKGVT